MRILNKKRCIIGEGPVWNEFEKKLYFTNGFGNEICIYDIYRDELKVIPTEKTLPDLLFLLKWKSAAENHIYLDKE